MSNLRDALPSAPQVKKRNSTSRNAFIHPFWAGGWPHGSSQYPGEGCVEDSLVPLYGMSKS